MCEISSTKNRAGAAGSGAKSGGVPASVFGVHGAGGGQTQAHPNLVDGPLSCTFTCKLVQI